MLQMIYDSTNYTPNIRKMKNSKKSTHCIKKAFYTYNTCIKFKTKVIIIRIHLLVCFPFLFKILISKRKERQKEKTGATSKLKYIQFKKKYARHISMKTSEINTAKIFCVR